MSIRRIAQGFAGILILAPSTRAFASGNECDPKKPRRTARLVIENMTVCDVAIYVDGRYSGECPAMTMLPLQTRKLGMVRLTARSRCDYWGPKVLTLAAGETVRWRIGFEVPRDARRGLRSPSDVRPVNNSVAKSGDQLQQVLRRDEDEDRPDKGDADDLRRDLHLDADRLASNLFEDQEQKQPTVDDR